MRTALIALVLVAAAQPAQGQHRIADLAGMTPAQLIRRLDPVHDNEPTPYLSGLDGADRIDLYGLGDFQPQSDVNESCRLQIGNLSSTDVPAMPTLVFRNGRLESVRAPPPIALSPPIKDQDAWFRRPRASAWVGFAGALPVEAGLAAATDRLGATADEIVVVCQRLVKPAPLAPSPDQRPQYDSAGTLQGLALLPFAGRLPGLNRERERFRTEGPRIVAGLKVGAEPPGGLDRFARREGVIAYRSPRSDYVVLAINLGAEASNNLSRQNAVAMAGVRGGRVEWIAPNAGLFGVAASVCLDREGRPSRRIRGCTEYGVYSP